MHVRNFEGENLSQVLKTIKEELGPEAIILKTNTNKTGFKKSTVKITAAISEEDYRRKLQVDSVLNDEQKSQFYKAPSKEISSTIKGHGANAYQKMGLNKSVQKSQPSNMEDDFSSFLENDFQEKKPQAQRQREEAPSNNVTQEIISRNIPNESYISSEHYEHLEKKYENLQVQFSEQTSVIDNLIEKYHEVQSTLTNLLEQNQNISKVSELRQILRSFDLSEGIISSVLRKAQFELSEDELNNEDILYDLTLREIGEYITVRPASFSLSENLNEANITVLVSEGASGQSSMAQKLVKMCPNSTLIEFSNNRNNSKSFVSSFLEIDYFHCDSLQLLSSKVRELVDSGRNIFIDLKAVEQKSDETKKILLSLKKAFANVEIFLSLSAIHSELYNKKVAQKFKEVVDGFVVSHIDLCLNLSVLINLQFGCKKPYVFFGTGSVVPDDIEEASKERLIQEIFNI
jgi:flagellar biosynthesis GTPase FlhF